MAQINRERTPIISVGTGEQPPAVTGGWGVKMHSAASGRVWDSSFTFSSTHGPVWFIIYLLLSLPQTEHYLKASIKFYIFLIAPW